MKEAAEAAEMPYVVNRWIGGALTNFSEIKKRLARLATLTEEGETGELERKYTKKERVVIGRELDKLNFNFGGIKKIERTPHMMLVVDPRHDTIAVEEAKEMKMPLIGVMSSDSNISKIDHPVLVNDALQSSVQFALTELVEALNAGKAEYVPKPTRQNERPRRGGDRGGERRSFRK